MKDAIITILSTLAALAVAVFVFGYFVGFLEEAKCKARWPTGQWGYLTGCMVLHEGKLVPSSAVHVTITIQQR